MKWEEEDRGKRGEECGQNLRLANHILIFILALQYYIEGPAVLCNYIYTIKTQKKLYFSTSATFRKRWNKTQDGFYKWTWIMKPSQIPKTKEGTEHHKIHAPIE